MVRRIAVVLGAAAVVAASFTSVAQAAVADEGGSAPVTVPFRADAADSCGYTEGKLVWQVGRGPIADPGLVDVVGTVVDQPVPDVDTRCPEDRLITRASFIAYAGEEFVDDAYVVADNGRVDFRLQLTADFPFRPPADRVVVQVCRARTDIAFQVCGGAQEYPRPPVV